MSLELQIRSLATAIGADVGKITSQINAKAADLSALTTTQKGNLVAALNEVHALIQTVAGNNVVIDDAATAANKVWSSTKVNTAINAAVTALVNSSPAALDTLKELADALGGDPNFATTMTNALAKRVRFDASQTLTTAEKKTASTNIGVGDPETNFVTVYNTARDAP